MQPYKSIISQVLLDKNPHYRTVINKVDDVGEASEFRTFSYELLAGPDDLLVEQVANGCAFKFDYAKVYWNTKLGPEHERLVGLFKPGEVVVDVMAGVGPFAVPAGKRGVFVWANDMNPESYRWMKEAISRNKVRACQDDLKVVVKRINALQVQQYVMPFNEDGRLFIPRAADLVSEASKQGAHALEYPKFKHSRSNPQPRLPPTKIAVPPTISHFVMNLPASATSFLHHFKGLYAGKESLFAPHTETKLPMVHVHCFALKNSEDLTPNWPGLTMTAEEVKADLLRRVYDEIGVQFKIGNPDIDGHLEMYSVRLVAPNKVMYCLTFRIPPEVAFAPRSEHPTT
jgi:tRNA (guanine37-N1)-methyltransferase